MSRLILSGFLNRVLIPQTSRLIQKPSTNPIVPFRFLASYGKDLPPVDPKEVELRVFKSLSTHDKIEPQNVKINSHLSNDLGLDSLDHVEIMVALEDEFDINIEDVDAEKIHTVKDIVEFIVKYLQNKPDPRQNPGAKYDPNMDFGPQ